MKKKFHLCWFMLAMLISSVLTGCHSTQPLPKEQLGKLYLSQNLWYQHPQKIYSVGYKNGTILPAGSEVQNIKVGRKIILFNITGDAQQYRIVYQQKYSRLPIMQYADRLFTHKTLAELTEGLTPAEKEFIKTGVLKKGLSKKAILIGYGYPPAHRTPSTTSNVWRYWVNRFLTQQLIFGDDGKLKTFN